MSFCSLVGSKSCIGQASIEEDVTTGLNISELKKQLHDIASPPRNRSPHAVSVGQNYSIN